MHVSVLVSNVVVGLRKYIYVESGPHKWIVKIKINKI